MFKSIKQVKNNVLKQENTSQTLTATDHAKLVEKYFHVVNTTYDFQEFLDAYKNVLYHHMFVVTFWRERGGDVNVEELWTGFNNEKGLYITNFLYRCYEKGVLAQQKETILTYQSELIYGNIQYMENLLLPGIHLSERGHVDLWRELIKVMGTTYDFQEFLEAYKNLLYHKQQLVAIYRSQGCYLNAEEMLKDILSADDKEDWINEFFGRCYNDGVLNQNKDLIFSYSDELTRRNIEYLEELLIGNN